MTTPQQPPPPSTGDEREDAAAEAGIAAAAIMAAAEVTILAAMAAAIVAVVAGSLGVQMARRRVMRAVAGALGAASARIRQVHARAAQEATAGGTRAGGAGQPGEAGHAAGSTPAQGQPAAATEPGPGRTEAPKRVTQHKGHGAAPPLPGAPDQVAKAVLSAQRDAGQAFDAAMYAALGGKGSPLPPSNPYRAAVEKAMRRLTGIGEDVKDLTGAERAKQSLSRLQASQVVLDDLASQGLTGFTDSRGRRWSLDAYAEMATRTAASRLHLSTQLSLMAQAGNDLVIVDNPSKAAPCPLCRPYEGKVLSLSGATTGASTITDASGVQRTEDIMTSLADAVAHGLLHPNCRHSLIPWTEGAGAVATAGGKERGYVDHGQPISEPLPIGTPQQYTDEQKLRAHERNVRAASMRLSAAVTPQARVQGKARLAHARAGLEAHVKATGALRQPRREKAGVAR